MNEEILNQSAAVPVYSLEITEVSETHIDARLNFVEASLVSKGAHLDRVNIWFRDLTWFVRKEDGQNLSTRLLVQEFPPLASSESEKRHIENSNGAA